MPLVQSVGRLLSRRWSSREVVECRSVRRLLSASREVVGAVGQ